MLIGVYNFIIFAVTIKYFMISFETKNVEMPQLDLQRIGIWLNDVAAIHNRKIRNLNYLFCNDEEILRINREFLRHDYFTDIITFDYSHKDKVGGDLFISLDTVKTNAEDLGFSYHSELLRVIVHGLLHLCGIDDKGPGEREIMERYENQALEIYNKKFENFK